MSQNEKENLLDPIRNILVHFFAVLTQWWTWALSFIQIQLPDSSATFEQSLWGFPLIARLQNHDDDRNESMCWKKKWFN